MTRSLETIVNNVSKVASLPEIYFKIDKILNDPMSSNIDLSRVIEEDPALTTRILRIANSALYGLVSKVETINHAIGILGTQQLRDLVLACSVLSLFKGVSESVISMESFWKHSIACGVIARNIASVLSDINVERYFVIGLLHDIGKVIMFMEIEQDMLEAIDKAEKDKCPIYLAEKESIGFTHAELGGKLLEKWKLSDRIVEGISCHHVPSKAQRYPVEAAIIHIADILANSLALGNAANNYVPKLSENAWKILNLNPEQLDTLITNSLSQYDDAINFILE